MLYCDPRSPTWTNIVVTLGFAEDIIEAQGYAACPVGTLIPPVTASPSYLPSQNYSTCNGEMTSSSGQTYDISSLITTRVQGENNEGQYLISLCSSTVSNCGLCTSSGFCETLQWYSNCVGQFGSAVPNPDGSGVTLYYLHGEFQRQGVVKVLCATTASANATISTDGNTATYYHPAACPVGSRPPPAPVTVPISTYNLLMAIGLAVGVALLIALVVIAVVYVVRGGRSGYQPIGNQ
jgi:hypothetical protein